MSSAEVVFANLVLTCTGAAVATTLLKGKYGLFAVGLLGIGGLVWMAGAVRLAKPDSLWARTFYDDTRLARACARFSGPSGREFVVAPTRPRPREVDRAFWLLLAAGVLMLPLGFFGGLLAGAFLVTVFLVRAGCGRARAALLVLAALHLAAQVVFVLLGAPLGVVLGDLAAAVPLVVAFHMLSGPAARTYLEAQAGQPKSTSASA